MDVTFMPQTSSTLKQLIADFSSIHFSVGDDFQWSSDSNTILHPAIKTRDDMANLLHEIGHACLGHKEYARDVELLNMERQAWEYAVGTIAPAYDIVLTMDDVIIDTALNSYRQWLHNRSTCPHCHAIGIEKVPGTYQCLICHGSWTVNEARTCQLRRYKQKPHSF